MSVEDLHNRKAKFSEQTARFGRAGYERFGAPEFILDQAHELAGPVLDVGTGSGITARALAGRGLEVVSVDMSGTAFFRINSQTAPTHEFKKKTATAKASPPSSQRKRQAEGAAKAVQVVAAVTFRPARESLGRRPAVSSVRPKLDCFLTRGRAGFRVSPRPFFAVSPPHWRLKATDLLPHPETNSPAGI